MHIWCTSLMTRHWLIVQHLSEWGPNLEKLTKMQQCRQYTTLSWLFIPISLTFSQWKMLHLFTPAVNKTGGAYVLLCHGCYIVCFSKCSKLKIWQVLLLFPQKTDTFFYSKGDTSWEGNVKNAVYSSTSCERNKKMTAAACCSSVWLYTLRKTRY